MRHLLRGGDLLPRDNHRAARPYRAREAEALPARARAEALGARRVRHECAEALGAIGDAAALRVLEEYERCDCEEVAPRLARASFL